MKINHRESSIYSIYKVKALWRWFINTYIHNLSYVRVIKTSKIFHCLSKKEKYLKFHNRWKELNRKESVDTFVNGAILPLNRDKTHKGKGCIYYPPIEDIRWLDEDGEQICYKCKCLSSLCRHNPKFLKKDDRGVIGWTTENKGWAGNPTMFQSNEYRPCKICQNHMTNPDSCKCKNKTTFYGYRFSNIHDYESERIADSNSLFSTKLSHNTIFRIAVRNKRCGSVLERNNTSYVKCLIFNEILTIFEF